MSYRIHTASASQLAVQWGTGEELSEAIGLEIEEGDDSTYLVLNDIGNQEAWVMAEDPEALRRLALKILADLDFTRPSQETA